MVMSPSKTVKTVKGCGIMLFVITRYRKRPIISKDENVQVEPTGSTSRTSGLELRWEVEDFSKKDLAVTTLSAQLSTVSKEE